MCAGGRHVDGVRGSLSGGLAWGSCAGNDCKCCSSGFSPQVLTELGIQHAGSGTQPTASQPAVVTTPSGHRVAFLSYSDHYEDWAATETTPGINFIDPSQ